MQDAQYLDSLGARGVWGVCVYSMPPSWGEEALSPMESLVWALLG